LTGQPQLHKKSCTPGSIIRDVERQLEFEWMFTRILEQAFPVPIPFSAAIPTLRSLRRPALFVEISKRKCAVFNFLVDLYARAGINRAKESESEGLQP
jgi:hypothetical protein